jgi:periplasmic protein CpxP/Spy
MKKTAIFILITTIIAATTIVFAQDRQKGLLGERGQIFREIIFNHVSAKLNLTKDQQTQVKGIMDNSRQKFQPLLEQMKSNRQQAKNSGTDGIFNEQNARELAEKQSEVVKQLIFEKEKTKAQIFAVLTPEQRTQAKKMMDDFEGRIKTRLFSTVLGGENLLSPNFSE